MKKSTLFFLLTATLISLNILHAENKTVPMSPESNPVIASQSASEKNDTLCLKIYEIISFQLKGYKITDLDGLTIVTGDSTKIMQNVLLGGFYFINVGGKNYTKQDTMGFHVLITTGNDTVVDRIVYYSLELAPNDTNGFVHDSTSVAYRYLKKGTYNYYASVIYTSKDGYFSDSVVELSSKTVTFYVDTEVPVRETLEENALSTFPNPASELLNVTCEEPMNSLVLFNAAGQQVRHLESCGNEAQIQLSGLPRGLYLLKVQTASGSAVRKVVVE
ncbi:MAG: T9SS type A sorting domain-containing protein [Bacteroidales bacterium]|nr:T9SS type A sorting domain-containing protein [Bacteroidales bacterium]